MDSCNSREDYSTKKDRVSGLKKSRSGSLLPLERHLIKGKESPREENHRFAFRGNQKTPPESGGVFISNREIRGTEQSLALVARRLDRGLRVLNPSKVRCRRIDI